MVEKLIKGLILGLLVGGAGYLIFKEIPTAIALGVVMVLSMFVQKKN